MRVTVAILSFLLATGLEAAGSFLCLIPTQGMHGNEHFLLVFLGFSLAFLVVNLVGAGIGLVPLRFIYSGDAWRHAVLGFMAGSVLSALSLSIDLELIPEAHANVLAPVRLVSLLVGLVSPPAGGLLALRRRQRGVR